MTSFNKPASKAGMLMLILLGSTMLFYLQPEAARSAGWTNSVLRNWEEFGFGKLQGKLVYNPGGIGAIEDPQLYTGHRAACLYPSFVIGHMFGGAGQVLFPFYLILTALVIVSIWGLVGRNGWGLLTAGLVVLSPGYLRCAIALDPLGVVVLLGFPVMLLCSKLLRLEKLTMGQTVLPAIVVCLFAALNWTSIFVLAIFFVWLLVQRLGGTKRLLAFGTLIATSVTFVSVISLLDKAQSNTSGPMLERLQAYFNTYLFGGTGYDGAPMNWAKAGLRLVTANTIGLLPVLLVVAVALGQRAKQLGKINYSCFLPLGVALLFIAGLRNYFAHHPWMAAPVLLVGIILSLQLLLDLPPATSAPLTPARTRSAFWPALLIILGGFAYGGGLTIVTRTNSIEIDNLVTMVHQNTARSAVLAISPHEPSLGQDYQRLGAVLDRQVVLLAELKNLSHSSDSPPRPAYHLTTAPVDQNNWRLVATSAPAHYLGHATVAKLLQWYRQNIARRKQGDRLEMAATYLLYQWDPGTPPPQAEAPAN